MAVPFHKVSHKRKRKRFVTKKALRPMKLEYFVRGVVEYKFLRASL